MNPDKKEEGTPTEPTGIDDATTAYTKDTQPINLLLDSRGPKVIEANEDEVEIEEASFALQPTDTAASELAQVPEE